MKWIRTAALVATFGAVAFVFGRVVVFPHQEVAIATTKAQTELPPSIPLEGWTQSANTVLLDRSKSSQYLSGKAYRYTHQSANLQVDARYLADTNGDVRGYITSYFPNAPDTDSWEVHTTEAAGSFLMRANEPGRLQISSCINPYGKSTVSTKSYQHNRNFQDIRHRTVPWLLGESLKDNRCLWTHMSLSQEGASTSELYSLIEGAWADWYQWWSIQLPDMNS